MKVLAAFAVAFAFAAALVLGTAPVSAASTDVGCPPTLGSWKLFSSGQSSRDDLGTWYLGCTYEPEAGSGEFGQVSVVATWSDTGEVGQGGCSEEFPEEPLPDGGVRGTLRSRTNEATVDYTIPSQFDRQTALDLARQLLAATQPLAVPCGGSTAPGPGKVTCPPTMEGLPLLSDPDVLSSEKESDDQLAASGIGHASCSYLGENLPGGYLNSTRLSVSWLIERTGEAQALLGIGPCESETVSRRPGPVSVASSTKEVTSDASWSRREPEPESFVVALTDLVKQAEPFAIPCDQSGGSGGSGSGSDQTGGDDAAAPTTTTDTGIPTDAEFLIAAGLIMTLLGGGPMLLKPLLQLLSMGGSNPAKGVLIDAAVGDPDAALPMATDAAGRDVTAPDVPPSLPPPLVAPPPSLEPPLLVDPSDPMAPSTVAPPEPPIRRPPPKPAAPVDDEWLPTTAPDKNPAPGDLNHPTNTQPTVTHEQLIDWLRNVEAVNPGKTWQQVTARIHSTLFGGVDVDDSLPIVPIRLFEHGPLTDGYQDVALPTKHVPQWVVDPSGHRIDLGHVMAGLRSDFNRTPGRFAEMMQWANTDGGDTWQQIMEPFLATYNAVWERHRPTIVDRAPPDQRRGNSMSLSARSYFRDPSNGQAPLSKYFEDQFSQPSP